MTRVPAPAWTWTALVVGGVALSPPARAEEPGTPGAASGPTAPATVDPSPQPAAPTPNDPPPQLAVPAAPAAAPGAPFAWPSTSRRVGVPEYVAVPTLLAATAALQFAVPAPEHARWHGGILFDEWARRGLVAGTRGGRDGARHASDALLVASFALPVSDLGVAWLARGSGDAAWQMAVIDAQAYALTLALNTAAKNLVARERPFGRRCDAGAGAGYPCDDPERNRSFYSGHSAQTATGAGLVCAHHLNLHLYGSAAADGATCGAAVAVALTTGALRMVADYHYASDVLLGHLLGAASGFVFPTLVYYSGRPSRTADAGRGPSVSVLPAVSAGQAGLQILGAF